MLKENLKRAQQCMSSLANEHQLDKHFSVGDMVFLRLQNYWQHSVELRRNKKLSKLFYGPFKIIKKIGAVAYRLELPPGARIHPVFHVSLLREAKGKPEPIPLPVLEDQQQIQPSRVLDYRGTGNSRQVLIEWQNLHQAEATWEPYDEVKARFPELQLEDELSVKGGAVDTAPLHVQSEDRAMPERTIRKPKRFQE
ncbi:uncharacterized protein LOC143578720 [Bidens hawaiensis]|uniref:uncharacterized protein LOC143578720 n=1 Tax=Bidens hawaiensis TaxID=980011 RepID=UPI00404ADE05